MHKKYARVSVAFTAAFVLTFSVFGQVTSRLSGSVQDPSGAAVPAAVVDVYMPGGGKPILTTNTTAEGLFAFTGIAAGTYDVVITAPGFRKHTERGVVLTPAAETSLSLVKLEIGSVGESVEVTTAALTV